jgi:hypothetical protein
MQQPEPAQPPASPIELPADQASSPRVVGDSGDCDAGAGIGAFAANLFVCMLTNAAADYKSDTSLKNLLSSLALPPPPQDNAAATTSTETPSTAAVASSSPANSSKIPPPNPAEPSVASSLIICPATSPNALAIAAYCQMWRPNAIWPCCSFVMISPSVPVAAIYESIPQPPSLARYVGAKTCTHTRSLLLQQCVYHLRDTLSRIILALPAEQFARITSGTHGPFPADLSGEQRRVTRLQNMEIQKYRCLALM